MSVRERLTAELRAVQTGRQDGVRVVEAVVERLGTAEGIEIAAAIGFVISPNVSPAVLRLRDYLRLDAARQEAAFNPGCYVRAGHRWLILDGRHYDADCPDGVDRWQDLPVFRRLGGGH